jgi:hypothetical protein
MFFVLTVAMAMSRGKPLCALHAFYTPYSGLEMNEESAPSRSRYCAARKQATSSFKHNSLYCGDNNHNPNMCFKEKDINE